MVSFAGAAIGIILWRQKFCRDKLTFVATKLMGGGGGVGGGGEREREIVQDVVLY